MPPANSAARYEVEKPQIPLKARLLASPSSIVEGSVPARPLLSSEAIRTTSSGRSIGSGRKNSASSVLNTATFDAIPMVSRSRETKVNAEFRASERRECRAFRTIDSSHPHEFTSRHSSSVFSSPPNSSAARRRASAGRIPPAIYSRFANSRCALSSSASSLRLRRAINVGCLHYNGHSVGCQQQQLFLRSEERRVGKE